MKVFIVLAVGIVSLNGEYFILLEKLIHGDGVILIIIKWFKFV